MTAYPIFIAGQQSLTYFRFDYRPVMAGLIISITMNTISSLRYIAVVGMLVLLLSSCASTISRFRLEPVSGDIARIDGRAVTKAERKGIVVVASFEREDMEFVAFDIEVKNKTDQPISVNPADFQYALLGSAQDTLTEFRLSDGTLVRQAADPSYESGRVEVKQKKEHDNNIQCRILQQIYNNNI